MNNTLHAQTPLLAAGRAKDWTDWVEWVRTTLSSEEELKILSTLTAEQREHLVKDYAWVRGVGVVWKSPEQGLNRRRFTHGACFRTKHGEFYINSEGSTRSAAATPRVPIV